MLLIGLAVGGQLAQGPARQQDAALRVRSDLALRDAGRLAHMPHVVRGVTLRGAVADPVVPDLAAARAD
eukprot:1137110-Pelagomonas_calceolata.AAC.5